MNIEQRVKEIAKEQIGVDEVTNELTLESLGVDSLGTAEFVMTLEDEFDIAIEDEAAEQLDTIQGFIDLVRNLKVA